jgi:hypothetical protein
MTDPTDRDFARLLDLVEGRLTEEEARAVAGDGADAAWLRAFLRASEDTVIESPPEGFRDSLIEHFEARTSARAEARRGPGFVERIRAVLQFDSGMQPAFGMRSESVQESRRQLVYSSETADVAIDVHGGREGNLDLVGQVMTTDPSATGPFGFQILSAGEEVALTATDKLGMFSIEGVPPGEYDVVVSGDTFEVSLSPVTLRP